MVRVVAVGSGSLLTHVHKSACSSLPARRLLFMLKDVDFLNLLISYKEKSPLTLCGAEGQQAPNELRLQLYFIYSCIATSRSCFEEERERENSCRCSIQHICQTV